LEVLQYAPGPAGEVQMARQPVWKVRGEDAIQDSLFEMPENLGVGTRKEDLMVITTFAQV